MSDSRVAGGAALVSAGFGGGGAFAVSAGFGGGGGGAFAVSAGFGATWDDNFASLLSSCLIFDSRDFLVLVCFLRVAIIGILHQVLYLQFTNFKIGFS